MAFASVGNQTSSLRLAGRGPASVGERLREGLRRVGPPLAGSALPFALVLYLALRGGGYDVIVRNEVGLVVWWIALLGAVVGALPLARANRPARWGFALFAGLAAWTALSMLWTESVESSFDEFARIGTYLGVFTLALALQGRDGLRRTVYAVGAAIAVVSAVAVLSRLHPSWFPVNELAEAAPAERSRLSYPLNYWNGVAAFVAIGLPLVLAVAASSKRLLTQALATAALPLMALAIFYTYSRTGAIVGAIGIVAFLLGSRRRLASLPTLALGALGSVLLVAAASQREALRDGLATDLALQQGNEMIALVIVTVTGIGLIRVAIALADRYGIGPRPSLPAFNLTRRRALAGLGAAVAVLLVAGLASGAPSKLADRWQEFKSAGGAGDSTARFEVASGNGRYQYWGSAIDAFESEPLTGIGAGSYEYWWLREGTLSTPIRDAHSLYFETLGELGLVGLALVLALLALVIVRGSRAARAAPSPARELLAGAIGAAIAFAITAGNDWLWEISVIPVAFLILAAAVLSWRGDEGPDQPPPSLGAKRLFGAMAAFAVLGVLVVSLLGAHAIRDSQAAARAGDLEGALADARSAQDAQPFAAGPHVQESLILIEQADAEGAVAAAKAATEREPTNWRTWYTLWRAELSRPGVSAGYVPAREAFARAYELNPLSPTLAPSVPPELQS